MTLYHYTCAHTYRALGESGTITPLDRWNMKAARKLPAKWSDLAHLLWFTDLDTPDRDALGLTSKRTRCDRTEYRYRAVDEYGIVPWMESVWRGGSLRRLEAAPGAMPRHWFVTSLPIPVVYDPP